MTRNTVTLSEEEIHELAEQEAQRIIDTHELVNDYGVLRQHLGQDIEISQYPESRAVEHQLTDDYIGVADSDYLYTNTEQWVKDPIELLDSKANIKYRELVAEKFKQLNSEKRTENDSNK